MKEYLIVVNDVIVSIIVGTEEIDNYVYQE
jgi:hypothetical protein